jgi:ATP-dependent Clp protease ATP-binding subunit ClpA
MTYDAKVINYITKNVYNPEYWAREVRRYLVDNIEDLIAEKIINTKRKKSFHLSIIKNKLEIK